MYGSLARKQNLLVVGATEGRSRLRLFDLRRGRLMRSFDGPRLADCREIGGVAIDDAWHVHVTNRRDHCVHVVTLFGGEVARYGAPAARRTADVRRALFRPNAIATHESGLIYVACGDRPLVHGVQIFDVDGRHRGRLRAFGENEESFNAPHGIRASGERVYVADTGNGCIHTYSIHGTFLSVFSTATERGERSRPMDVLPLPGDRGGMLVAQGGEESALKEFDREGRFVRFWARAGEGAGEVLEPASMVWDGAGRLLVIDAWGGRVQGFVDARPAGGFPVASAPDAGDHEASSRR